jgi:hypothetical protein
MFRICYQVRTYLEMTQMGYEEWQQAMQTAKAIVAEIRREYKAYLVIGDKTRSKNADELKGTLPGACFQTADVAISVGTKKFNKGKRGRWREMRHAFLNGLVVIDIDHLKEDPRQLFVRLSKEYDLKALGILLVYVSARGEGLKIVFKARPAAEWGNLICQQYEMASLLGLLEYVDDSCKDSTRLSWLTGPDDVLYCDTKELFNVEPQND